MGWNFGLNGPNLPPPGLADVDCEAMDFDEDGDVDQTDHGIIQRCLSGSGNPARPDCGVLPE